MRDESPNDLAQSVDYTLQRTSIRVYIYTPTRDSRHLGTTNDKTRRRITNLREDYEAGARGNRRDRKEINSSSRMLAVPTAERTANVNPLPLSLSLVFPPRELKRNVLSSDVNARIYFPVPLVRRLRPASGARIVTFLCCRLLFLSAKKKKKRRILEESLASLLRVRKILRILRVALSLWRRQSVRSSKTQTRRVEELKNSLQRVVSKATRRKVERATLLRYHIEKLKVRISRNLHRGLATQRARRGTGKIDEEAKSLR